MDARSIFATLALLAASPALTACDGGKAESKDAEKAEAKDGEKADSKDAKEVEKAEGDEKKGDAHAKGEGSCAPGACAPGACGGGGGEKKDDAKPDEKNLADTKEGGDAEAPAEGDAKAEPLPS